MNVAPGDSISGTFLDVRDYITTMLNIYDIIVLNFNLQMSEISINVKWLSTCFTCIFTVKSITSFEKKGV